MPATRDDVARLAGVSSSTVSYAISGRRTISVATRRRVEAAMAELNYTPNAFARGLAGARGGILALHYPYGRRGVTSSEFEYVAAATDRARERGYHLLLWSNPIDDVEGLGSLVSEGLVDGVILMELTARDDRVAVLSRSRLPFTNIGRPDDVEGLWFVDADYDSLARQAVDHLADLGHRRVFFLGQSIRAPERGSGPLDRTTRALRGPADERGLSLETHAATDSVPGGRRAFDAFAASTARPTAVLAFNEMALAGFVQAAAAAGRSIPDDLTVVALSIGDLAAEMTSPPLTTVNPPGADIAAAAVDDLVDRIEGRRHDAPHVLVAPRLVVRGTSAAAPSEWTR
ncbi:LacI family DNA-binding transcriptional regulator [Frigoribacterium sp. CFBP 13605]|jgi:DNA-binding LacI/PurR family transcriptional regulator|uniref:LacI family DNA-binding transcriptional regulator n=1 Tax=Frigoribacterium sp. CFBP 13605 TaxID=2774034 RepID=UPI0019079F65|nr:LacI family DNA-binding transcriptional regulator [Frigoribacterium sp. CFBP 13605]MBD8139161.1 LacI family DNA-binding transcriptional regulator [Frigoribacterium sp. CFBP 13605]